MLYHRPVCVCGLFFFFQAEDGIRDLTVTGVQTCALPIYEASGGADREVALALMREFTGQDLDGGVAVRPVVPLACVRGVDSSEDWTDSDQIGRASCRERV